jgi:hypothetical protein
VSAGAHAATIEIAVPAAEAFAYLADGMKQGQWALGSWNRREVQPGLYAGSSLFDGTELFIRLTGYAEHLLVEYEVGASPAELRPLVWARVVPGPVVGLDEGRCVVTLVVWRTQDETDVGWDRLGHAFATEVHMIKGRLELGF